MIGITERGDGFWSMDEWLRKIHKVDGAVVITKTPARMLKRFQEIPDNVILHCTITGLGGTILEPNVEPMDKAIEAFKFFEEKLGRRVVLRIDPIFPTKKGINLAQEVLTTAMPAGRVRISILDLYPHVKMRMPTKMLEKLEPIYNGPIHAPIGLRQQIVDSMKKIHAEIEVCGEPDLECLGCISQKDLDSLGLEKASNTIGLQRPACKCLAIKKELLSTRGRCLNNCMYCYWK